MLRAMEPLERELKKVRIRMDNDEKRQQLELELIVARSMEAQQVNIVFYM